ncbi:WD repeat-containing protein 6 [Rhodotorula kratochvilovae]
MAREGSLRRLAGHKGAVFTASFSPCTRFLVTGSDDRTLRVWDLSLLAVPDPSAPDSSSDADAVPHLALWGHSARVWRAAFVPSSPSLPPSRAPRLDRSGPSPPAPPTVPLHIASVAEDGTARLWRVSPSALARPPSSARDAGKSAKGYALVATFRDGHDGRSLWAVAPALLPSGRTVTLTGGANGAVRCWAVPRGEVGLLALLAEDGKEAGAQREGKGKEPKVKAFVAAPLEGEAGEGGRDLAVVLHDDGTFAAYPPSASLASPPIPFHSSPAWSGLSACTLRLLPSPSSGGFTLLASSNRGFFLHATLSCAGALVGAVSEWETGVRAADVHVGEVDASGKGEVAVWDRAGWRVVLLEVDEASVRERPPTILASLALTATSPTTAPTALHLLSPTLLLLGAASGSLSLFRISDQTLSPLCSTERAHEDGIAHLAACATDRARGEWTVASVGRDGARCVLHVEVDEARGAARMELQDRRVLSKGSLEEIVHVGSKEEIYLALVEGRAALLDRLGQQLHSFVGAGPSKKVPFQLVRAQDGSLRYYRLVAGQLLVQSVSSAASLPVPILRSGLHGREIRTLEVMRTADGTSLVATAAENGVLSVSKLHSSKHLDPLFTARHLPSALKALAWSSPPRSSTSPALLFACGARELLCAYSLSYSPAGDGELHVLPCGQVLAPEGGEVRAMDLAVAQLEAGDDGQERNAVVVGYSDGSLRLWLHDAAAASFSLVVRSQEEGKCLLQVELVEVDLREGGRRWIAVTSASDGLLALRDVSSFVNANPPDRSSLPPPFFSFHPHQSGINALALSLSGSTLLVATGGDDNALSVARVTLCLSPLANGDGSRLVAQLGTQASLDDVHASTITGFG